VLQSLITSTASTASGVTKEHSPQYQVVIEKVKEGGAEGDMGCVSQTFDGTDPSTGKYEWTYTCLRMKMVPVNQ
jgi:hypothetical protein